MTLLKFCKIMNWVAIAFLVLAIGRLFMLNPNFPLIALFFVMIPYIAAVIALTESSRIVSKYVAVVLNGLSFCFWVLGICLLSFQSLKFAILGVMFLFVFVVPAILNMYVLWKQADSLVPKPAAK